MRQLRIRRDAQSSTPTPLLVIPLGSFFSFARCLCSFFSFRVALGDACEFTSITAWHPPNNDGGPQRLRSCKATGMFRSATVGSSTDYSRRSTRTPTKLRVSARTLLLRLLLCLASCRHWSLPFSSSWASLHSSSSCGACSLVSMLLGRISDRYESKRERQLLPILCSDGSHSCKRSQMNTSCNTTLSMATSCYGTANCLL